MSQIVVIEDHEQSARLAEKLLSRAGHEVILAEDGEMGMSAVFENTPDLVLIDLGLPDIDGQTVVALLRQQVDLEHVPIVAFTAWPRATAASMAQAYGCDGVIVKPLDTREFAGQIEEFIRKKQQDAG